MEVTTIRNKITGNAKLTAFPFLVGSSKEGLSELKDRMTIAMVQKSVELW